MAPAAPAHAGRLASLSEKGRLLRVYQVHRCQQGWAWARRVRVLRVDLQASALDPDQTVDALRTAAWGPR